MLTLQNDPPNLDSSAESPDQFKNYGKTIRRFVTDCLKRDPESRPTAKQLLKHDFFKKAKVVIYKVSSRRTKVVYKCSPIYYYAFYIYVYVYLLVCLYVIQAKLARRAVAATFVIGSFERSIPLV